MRLEIVIEDDRPEAKILQTQSDPTSYVLGLVRSDRAERAFRQGDTQPDYSKIFNDAQNCPSAFKTREEIDAYINRLRDEWQ